LHAQNKPYYAYDQTIHHQSWCSEQLALSDKLGDPTLAETFHVTCELTLVSFIVIFICKCGHKLTPKNAAVASPGNGVDELHHADFLVWDYLQIKEVN
jgi:hypothetical protein